MDINRGLPGMQVVGIPNTAVKEARERINWRKKLGDKRQ
ncbi:hypothetical protein [Carboxydothermus hydrogenoformans]|uniref:Uncharacterized protein n=1 Tax=Carboxydothermus hydrogenoformans (strain ATCC BAA-161 / DSM 6008 / Z-2901) TaxID=246194 RepID=Q3ACV6_CARHZ|nr:hypothetical protein CHY_1183 [Carboxydothermus hydrogenoformans Z-2901]